jgi:hypothetical protein
VEFLIVFIPFFLLFLGICQIALVGAARFVVQHAAGAAARAAVVVLESNPSDFGGVERGWVSRGSGRGSALPEALLESLGVGAFGGLPAPVLTPADRSIDVRQQGARMAPIRFAAYVPLAVLAPLEAWLEPKRQDGSLGDALAARTQARLGAALFYNRAGAVVTIQAAPGSDELTPEPIARKAPVTVRVTYLYYCSIPVVRVLGCKTLTELIGTPSADVLGLELFGVPREKKTTAQRRLAAVLALAEDSKTLARLDAAGARFAVLTGETTLPNQGAAYY